MNQRASDERPGSRTDERGQIRIDLRLAPSLLHSHGTTNRPPACDSFVPRMISQEFVSSYADVGDFRACSASTPSCIMLSTRRRARRAARPATTSAKGPASRARRPAEKPERSSRGVPAGPLEHRRSLHESLAPPASSETIRILAAAVGTCARWTLRSTMSGRRPRTSGAGCAAACAGRRAWWIGGNWRRMGRWRGGLAGTAGRRATVWA